MHLTVAGQGIEDAEFLKTASKDERHAWVMKQGAKHFCIWGVLGVTGHLILSRKLPLYAKQTNAFKVSKLVFILSFKIRHFYWP